VSEEEGTEGTPRPEDPLLGFQGNLRRRPLQASARPKPKPKP